MPSMSRVLMLLLLSEHFAAQGAPASTVTYFHDTERSRAEGSHSGEEAMSRAVENVSIRAGHTFVPNWRTRSEIGNMIKKAVASKAALDSIALDYLHGLVDQHDPDIVLVGAVNEIADSCYIEVLAIVQPGLSDVRSLGVRAYPGGSVLLAAEYYMEEMFGLCPDISATRALFESPRSRSACRVTYRFFPHGPDPGQDLVTELDIRGVDPEVVGQVAGPDAAHAAERLYRLLDADALSSMGSRTWVGGTGGWMRFEQAGLYVYRVRTRVGGRLGRSHYGTVQVRRRRTIAVELSLRYGGLDVSFGRGRSRFLARNGVFLNGQYSVQLPGLALRVDNGGWWGRAGCYPVGYFVTGNARVFANPLGDWWIALGRAMYARPWIEVGPEITWQHIRFMYLPQDEDGDAGDDHASAKRAAVTASIASWGLRASTALRSRITICAGLIVGRRLTYANKGVLGIKCGPVSVDMCLMAPVGF